MNQRGAITIVAVTGALLLSLTALASADLGAMLVARSRAQAAADAAALAAVVAQVPILGREGDPAEAARAMAESNGAVLERCSCEPGTTFAEVTVTHLVRPILISIWRGRPARASARAEVDPDVLSYRDEG